MKKLWSIVSVAALVCAMIPFATTLVSAAPTFRADRTVYAADDTITITYSGTDTNDWTGIYPAGLLPGSGQNSITWQYTVGSGHATFPTSALSGAGEYVAFLCDNDGYTVLDSVMFTVRSTDPTDYGVTNASVKASVTNGKSSLAVTVTPSSAASLTYRLYWAKNGVRLQDYLPIKELTHSGSGAFTITCNDCLFMPNDADSIEVAVVEGASTSCFVEAPQKLKAPASTYRYSFQVLTDLHASADHKAHIPNLKMALRDVTKNSPNSIGIFTAGDNTDRGTQAQYDLLLQTINEVKAEVKLPPITFAIGNHDEVYGGTYQEEVERFIRNFNTPGLYYSVVKNGTKFIMLGSEEQSTAGTISDTQLAWLQSELASVDTNMPVFVFLHQPLKDTVSGTLSWKNNGIQRWYLGEAAGNKLHGILKNYPNAIFFSGHTHSSFEQEQPMLYGNGVDATFINASSTAYLWGDDNLDFQGSQGLYVEVYEDYILVKGRDFTRSKWCAVAQFLIPVGDGAKTYEGDLMAESISDWSFDSAVMNVEATDYSTVFYNTDGKFPCADYVLESPITFDPADTTLYADLIAENGASTNILMIAPNGAPLSLIPMIDKADISDASGDLIGNGQRLYAAYDLADYTFPADMLNTNGTVTVSTVRVYASGAANAKLTVFDLSLVNDRSAKAVSLIDTNSLQAVDLTKRGGYRYDNGTLTVTADSDDGYAVTFAPQTAYDITVLRNWLVDVQATTAFDIAITASTAGANTTFGLAADYWPMLCDAKDNGYIPAGNYAAALDFYSAFSYNGLLPANGRSKMLNITVTLRDAGTVTINGLQLSSATTAQSLHDGLYFEDSTPKTATGDVNEDGIVNTVDVRRILKFTLGGELTATQQAAADVNGDGKVTTVDCRELLKVLLV